MDLKRPWIAAGATLAIAGFGGALAVTSSDVVLNDRQQAPQCNWSPVNRFRFRWTLGRVSRLAG